LPNGPPYTRAAHRHERATSANLDTHKTGGVTLTLSLAYLAVLAHQRNRERQSVILRANHTVISGLTDPLPPTHPPTRAELAAAHRANLVVTAKDRWNAELEGAVHWAQNTDWTEVREGLEIAARRLWARAQGREFVEPPALPRLPRAQEVRDRAVEAGNQLQGKARAALADAKARGVEAVSKGEKEAEEAKNTIFGAVGRAFGYAKERVEDVVGKVEDKVDGTQSAIEQALKQRYEPPTGLDRSVEEVLAERYAPMDQNTKL
jgi:MICOS complex subunit MIC12